MPLQNIGSNAPTLTSSLADGATNFASMMARQGVNENQQAAAALNRQKTLGEAAWNNAMAENRATIRGNMHQPGTMIEGNMAVDRPLTQQQNWDNEDAMRRMALKEPEKTPWTRDKYGRTYSQSTGRTMEGGQERIGAIEGMGDTEQASVVNKNDAAAWKSRQPSKGMTVYGPDGNPIVEYGGSGTSVAPVDMKEHQGKNYLYGNRMDQAGKIINDLEASIANKSFGESIGQAAYEQAVGTTVGNRFVSEEYQRFDQAKRDFVNAVLRKESGAVISDVEFANAEKQYFPRPGDSKAVVAQKRRNRELATQNIKQLAGGRLESSKQEDDGVISTQEQYNALPSGASYTDANGVSGVKP